MFKILSTYHSVLNGVIVVVVSVVSNFVYADEQSFVYVSDLIQRQSNNEREIWQYQNEVPLAYRNKSDSFQIQYSYVPPTQKIGSNPISNPQHNISFIIRIIKLMWLEKFIIIRLQFKKLVVTRL